MPTPQQIARVGHITAFLRSEMTKRNMKPTDLTKALGIKPTATTIYPWLRGVAAPMPKWRPRLAKIFGVPVTTFEPRALTSDNTSIAVPRTIVTRPLNDPLTFSVTADGVARIRLDVMLPIDVATPLLRMLLDAGIIFNKSTEE